MSRSRIAFVLLSVTLLGAIAFGTWARAAAGGDSGEDSLYKHLSVFSEVLHLLRRTYVEEPSMDRLFDGALDSTTDALDSLATYVPASAVEEFRRTLEVGPGRSGLTVAKDRGIAFVVAVMPASPAAAAGLRKGDIITRVGEDSTREMPLWQLQGLLASEAGTSFKLGLMRRGQAQDAELTLADYEPPAPRLERHDGVAVLTLAHLQPGTEARVRAILESLAGAGDQRLVLDLRAVAGGSSATAYAVAELFAEGDLGELRGRDGALETYASPGPPVWSGRLVVLTDRGSQGPSEILASVLDQAAGAELVGERTFGHAGRSITVPLASGAALYLADSFYTGPDREPIDAGIEPDVAVTEAGRNLAEADVPLSDLILKRGLERLAEKAAA